MPPEQQNSAGPILEASPVADSREADECIENVPDGGYGWVQVGVAFTINCFTWGQTAVNIYLEKVYFCEV